MNRVIGKLPPTYLPKNYTAMRLHYITTIAAVATVTVAKPHPHVHRQVHGAARRDARPDNVAYVPATVETHIVYMLDGHSVSEEEVRQGISNGTLMWGEDGSLSTSAKVPVALATPSPTRKQDPQPVSKEDPKPTKDVEVDEKPKPTPSAEKPVTDSTPSPLSDPLPPQQQDAPSNGWTDLVDKNGHCDTCDKEFPNGKIPCTEFPYGYGALPLAHEGLGGWSGIQAPLYRGTDGFDDITTVPKGSCNDGSCCTPGSFCSYGCPNPYLKLSFPQKQGRTGQSVGGLFCNDHGFLEMADGSIGKTLCGNGSKDMTVKVQNNLSKSVSICRTDYPGKIHGS